MGASFLDRLDAEALEELRRVGVKRSWPRGATIFHQGDPADRVVVVEEGVVKVLSTSGDGIETVLGLRSAGDLLGELAAIDGGVRSASVVVVEPVTALVLGVQAFRRFATTRPAHAEVLLELVTARARDASRRQADLGSVGTTTRLARALVELAGDHGRESEDGIEITLVTQDELAAMCGVSRESVARGLAELRAAGLVETGRRTITVNDLGALTTRAERSRGS